MIGLTVRLSNVQRLATLPLDLLDEAVGRLAMSEHLPGVTMTVQLAVSVWLERRTAEWSSPGRISSSSRSPISCGAFVGDQAAR